MVTVPEPSSSRSISYCNVKYGGRLTSTGSPTCSRVARVHRVLVSTNNNGRSALPGNSSDDTGLTPSVFELCNLDTRGTTSRDDRLYLLEQPIGRLFSIGRCVVSVVKVGEGGQSGAQVSLAQLRQQGLDGSGLSDSAREASEELKAVANFIEVSDVDKVLVFLW
jgi:hypothetical protein